MRENEGKYFTKEPIPIGYVYRLAKMNGGSDKYGVCEVCDKEVDSTYLITQSRRYYCTITHQEQATHHKCFQYFGHKSCLSNITN